MGDIAADQFICAYCHVQANQRCTGCHETFYCSREHQKLHWRKHKNQCCAFKVRLFSKVFSLSATDFFFIAYTTLINMAYQFTAFMKGVLKWQKM